MSKSNLRVLKLCKPPCFKTSLLLGTSAVHGGSEIYIPLVQGLRGRKVPLMRSMRPIC
ncbi:hypothetical protein HMPREF9554_00735 [Treponema phagedenis F0421]|nr:hypothetical protein HMPREF9554_00735 [Treponema phagedenis F0421]